MKQAHRRHDISDYLWELLAPHLPGQSGQWGGIAKDNRLFINAVFWILRTGAPWRDLPPDYGDWKNTHRRFCRWRDKGIWDGLLEVLVKDPDYEWLMIDATHIKVHAHGMPVRMFITLGTTADCTQGSRLIKELTAENLLADKGYDSNEIIDADPKPQSVPRQVMRNFEFY